MYFKYYLKDPDFNILIKLISEKQRRQRSKR
jgi:hypothetical protein